MRVYNIITARPKSYKMPDDGDNEDEDDFIELNEDNKSECSPDGSSINLLFFNF